MPSSLKSKLKKFKYQSRITEKEYTELIRKIHGHDIVVKANILEEVAIILKDSYDVMNVWDKDAYCRYIDSVVNLLKEDYNEQNI